MKGILKLMRLDKPIGIYLLWFPTAWALALTYGQQPPLQILIYFLLGTVCMRSAGCIINDIADRRIDGHVWRTKNRPLVTGETSLITAWLLLCALLFVALIILIQLPKNCFYVALLAVCLTFIYPFCKRFLPTPQMILGFAFACSIPMVNIASAQPWSNSLTLLVFLTVIWVISYDTEYALADLADDRQVGILSSAIYFGRHVKSIIIALQVIMHCLWLIIAYSSNLSHSFYVFWFVAWFFCLPQWYLLTKNNPQLYLQAFKLNAWYGLFMWLGVSVSMIPNF